MADVTDFDATGADISFDSLDLSPASGIDPGRIPRAITTASQSVFPETASPITAPLSVTDVPSGSQTQPIAAAPGKPVNLAPPSPANIAQPQVAQVVPAGSVAPQVQRGLFGAPIAGVPQIQGENEYDAAIRQETKKRDDAAKRAQGPIMNFMDQDWTQKQAEIAKNSNMEIMRLKQLKQQQIDMQMKADNAGIPRDQQTPTQTNDTIVENLVNKWRTTGDANAADALTARGHKDLVEAYKPDAMTALETKKNQGAKLMQRLDAAKTDVDYNNIRDEISGDAKTAGFSIPTTRAQWDVERAQRDDQKRRANLMLDKYRQDVANTTSYTNEPDEKVAKITTGGIKMYDGSEMPGTTAKTHLGNGTKGAAAQFGSNDIRKYGDDTDPKSWNAMTPDVKKNLAALRKELVPDAEMQKFKGLVRITDAATHDNKGNLLPEGRINTNPNIMQGLGEVLTAEFREGSGGANASMMKLELANRGWAQGTIDNLMKNYAGFKGVVTGKAGEYLSKLTEGQKRDVIDFLSKWTNKNMGERLGGIAETIGMHGGKFTDVGIDDNLGKLIEDKRAYGRDKQKFFMSNMYRVPRENDSVFLGLDDSNKNVPGAIKTPLPMSALPGLAPKPPQPAGPPAGVPGGGPPGTPPAVPLPPLGKSGAAQNVPPAIANNNVAQTVYGTAGQTASNLVPNNPALSQNVARVTASSAQSESNFNPNTLHDNDKVTGQPRGQGLFGHNADRLAAMQQFAGLPVTGKPGAPIPPNVQSSFYAREMLTAAKNDPFIAQTLSNPNASAEDLTRVQMRMEKPEGFKLGQEEKAPSWNARLKNTQAMMAQQSGVAANMPYPNATTRQQMLANYNAGVRQSPEEAATYQARRDELSKQTTASGAHLVPAVGAAAGGVLGSVVPGVGTVAGAAAGGALGGGIEHYFTAPPEQQNARGYTEAGVFGGAKGAASAVGGLGIGGTAARVAANTAVPAIQKWWQGGDTEEVFDAGMKGMAEGAFGEAFGRGLGIGHQVWNVLSTGGKSELLAVAKVLSSQEPKIADATGKMVDNPLWLKAEARAKELHQDPDALKYNYDQTEKMVADGKIPKTVGEAVTQRPGAVEAAKTGRQDYDPIRNQIAEAPKAKGAMMLEHDPTSLVGKSVPNTQEFRDAAATAKNTMINGTNGVRPTNMREVWDNHIDARAGLLAKEREALSAAPYAGQDEAAKAYRAMADKVRMQQEALAKKFLPPDHAKTLMTKLETADVRYQRAMTAGGKDIVRTIAAGGDKGREAKAAFDALVGNDPQAKHMMQSLVNLQVNTLKQGATQAGSTLGALGTAAALLHFVPGVGPVAATAVVATKATQVIRDLMVLRGAGKTATFNSLVRKQLSDKGRARYVQASSALAGPAASQGLNMLGDGGAEPAQAASQ